MDLITKSMPNDINAEQKVLGSMLIDSEIIGDILEKIRDEEEFYHEQHKLIYKVIKEKFSDGKPIDMITVSDELTKNQLLEAVGGFEYLSGLTDIGMLIANVREHAEIIHEKYLLRRLIRSSSEIVEKGYNSESSEQLLDEAEQNIFDISENRNSKGFTPISEIFATTYSNLQELSRNPGKVTGISSGFSKLDVMSSGLQRSDFILIAARPSMGKTAFAINVCQNAAVNSGQSVAIFSLEMAKEQLVQRMLSAQALIPIGDLRTGNIQDDDWEKVAIAGSVLGNAPIYIDDTPAITVSEIRSKCRKLKMTVGLDLIMIDYIQLMSGGKKSENRQQEISTISRNLKQVAREMDCPVIALSQLSRAPELRADHRPILSDLRESGAIEQDADLVMFLYRDEYYNPESEELKGVGELIIAKQRNGETGKVFLAWLGPYTKFTDAVHME